MAMKAVILAGGFGTRISEESHLKPKPMIEIGGKPMIWHIMKTYIRTLLFKSPEKQEPDPLFPSLVSEKAMQKGLLVVHTGIESIKLAPPLTITDEALLEGLNVLDESIEDNIR